MMNPLTIFPRLRYVGGIVGHGLDLYLNEQNARYVRLSLKGRFAFNLERVVLYGSQLQADGCGTAIELSGRATATQSSVLVMPGETEKEAQQRRGAHVGNNGISNGYNYFSTAVEDNPWWELDLGAEYALKTIHIHNFCSGRLAWGADTLLIETSNDRSTWSTVYDRSASTILDQKYKKTLAAIRRGTELIPSNAAQRAVQRRLESVLHSLGSIAAADPASHAPLAYAASSSLLDFVNAFLPVSLEPGGKEYVFHNLSSVKKITVSYPDCDQYPPASIKISYYDGSVSNYSNVHEIEHNPEKAISQLKLYWKSGRDARFANSMCIQILTEEETLIDGDTYGWVTLHDNAKVADICAGIAWSAFLMGNNSPRCIGLVAKARLMPRRSSNELREAYYWCRLNMHSKSARFKNEIVSLVTSATACDFNATRLSFSRHSFATLLKDQNQEEYAQAIKLVMRLLNSLHLRSFVLYGTLLGAVRENAFIQHDDDVDIGYLSSHKTLEELKSERALITQAFQEQGWKVHDLTGHIHLTFMVQVPVGENAYDVELFPVWEVATPNDGFMAYMQKMEIHPIPADVIGRENATVCINGHEFPAPAKPEAFLNLRYGESWRTPDPYFEI